MRSLVYTVSANNLPLFETFSYQTAQDMKTCGFTVTTRFVERPEKRSANEKAYLARRFKLLAERG